jgi:hypothetical protein
MGEENRKIPIAGNIMSPIEFDLTSFTAHAAERTAKNKIK